MTEPYVPKVGFALPTVAIGGAATGLIRGVPTAILVWRKGCTSCRVAVPAFVRLSEAYPGGLVVGVAQEWAHDLVDDPLRSIADLEQGSKIARALHVQASPTYVLLDSRGIVRFSGCGWQASRHAELGAKMAELLSVEARPVVPEGSPAFVPACGAR